MISYAQNAEDVVLARALVDTPVGFYIDIGAFHPTDHSVTKHFYDRGWRSINVEPLPHLLERFVAERPEDVNLAVGILDHRGDAEIWEPDNSGASTFVAGAPPTIGARRHVVPVLTLADLCAAHVNDRTIDFLKIDAEGTEAQVIRGGDWTTWRPRILVVEATQPHEREQSHEEWEPTLLSVGYVFALFDGLNRFYVAEEEPELLEPLDRPACVLDDYETREVALLHEQLRQSAEYIVGLETALHDAQPRSLPALGRRLRSRGR